jgi:hypothetical protein
MATLKIAHDFRRQTDNLFFILRQCLAGNVNENQKESRLSNIRPQCQTFDISTNSLFIGKV